MSHTFKALPVLALLGCAGFFPASLPVYGQDFAHVSVGTTPGRTIPSTFMGYSHEWNQNFIGDSETGVNTIYRRLTSNLTAYGSGPLIIRMGGNTADQRQEPTPTMDRPYAELATALGIHFILSVNLGSSNPQMAADQASADQSQMPPGSILGFEIGNEPDLYHHNGRRASTYTVQNYFSEFATWKRAILPVLTGGVKLAGPAWGAYMQRYDKQFLSENHDALSVLTQHYYVTEPKANPPQDVLLTPASAKTDPMTVAPAVAMSHSYGIPFRVDEYNTIDDSGIAGISNVFGAALWAVDNMFEYANVGVDGVNWETSNWSKDYVQLFSFAIRKSGGTNSYALRAVNPLYYGLLFFQAGTGNGARLLPVSLNTSANLSAWATVDQSGTLRLALINKDTSQTGSVAVTMPGYAHATILRLTAPSYTATTGASFAGQTIGSDGALHGSRAVDTVGSVDGVFHVPMSVTSAALLTFVR